MMTTRSMRPAALVAGVAWLGVAVSGVSDVVAAEGEDWEVGYFLFMLALVIGAALTLALAAAVTLGTERPRLRTAGLVAGGLGTVMALIAAWALPVWMGLLGVGFGLLAAATDPGRRRPLALLGASQLAGIVVLVIAIEAEVGRQDSYGDYPAAGGIALVIVAVAAVAALFDLARVHVAGGVGEPAPSPS